MTEIKILLAEDHKIVREGTRQLLEQSPGMRVIGEAADGLEAVALTRSLAPDVVVMDVRLPGLNGLEATRTIKASQPQVQVLILSAYDDDRYIFPLLEAGASGYLLKTASGAELGEAIRTVHAGGTALSPQVASKLVRRVSRRALEPETLTDRELEVLRSAALGMSNKAIANSLSISVQTVQVHLRNVFGKLGVSSRSEAAAHAISHGWIRLGNEDE